MHSDTHSAVSQHSAPNQLVSDSLARLRDFIQQYDSAVVAFSGGLDSALVTWATLSALGAERTLAVTANSASLPADELAQLPRILTELGLPESRHRIINTQELDNPAYTANGPDRCYHCKNELYGQLEALRAREGFAAVFDGCNLSDLGDYRPGRRAAEEFNVVSPLLACELTKETVRAIARAANLISVADKPAAACLSSRAPHGVEITPEILRQIDHAESALRALGFSGLRVRYHHSVARIELPAEQLDRALQAETRAALVRVTKAAGFRFVTLDLEGYRTGSLNPQPSADESE
ncbi:MAG TPA: ATP-dependent sacrificial sulfur transferase LarE [candidate division Zixibacteria bacterium]|nr:ATP-dependent sacrificial sulfur transferase LarE [candidate division Zixibacteria bacterium]